MPSACHSAVPNMSAPCCCRLFLKCVCSLSVQCQASAFNVQWVTCRPHMCALYGCLTCFCFICLPHMAAMYSVAAATSAQCKQVCSVLYVCLICLPYKSALCFCPICLPGMSALYVCPVQSSVHCLVCCVCVVCVCVWCVCVCVQTRAYQCV